MPDTATPRGPGRRRGRWTYGNHEGLNPGWRLDGTNLVLDYDPHHPGVSVQGCYVLWTDGTPGDAIDHYLDAAMRWVEREIAPVGRAGSETNEGGR